MKYISFCLCLFVSIAFISCRGPATKKNLLKQENRMPTFGPGPYGDLNYFKQLKDTGPVVNNLREGTWTEYSIDSSLSNEPIKFVVGHDTSDWKPGPIRCMQIGNYKGSKRDSIWTTYNLIGDWYVERKTGYLNGLKEGEEIIYQNNGRLPLIISNYTNGIQTGVEKDFDINYPYKLKGVYKVVNGIRIPADTGRLN